jgi:hypothetical protein
VILYELVGGLLQLSMLAGSNFSTWKMLVNLWLLEYIWACSIYYISVLHSFKTDMVETTVTPDNAHAPSQQAPGSQSDSELKNTSSSERNVLLSTFMSLAGVIYIAWFFVITALQLIMLLGPCIMLYYQITLELWSWNDLDPTKPCPQLWKDALEDELWWF